MQCLLGTDVGSKCHRFLGGRTSLVRACLVGRRRRFHVGLVVVVLECHLETSVCVCVCLCACLFVFVQEIIWHDC